MINTFQTGFSVIKQNCQDSLPFYLIFNSQKSDEVGRRAVGVGGEGALKMFPNFQSEQSAYAAIGHCRQNLEIKSFVKKKTLKFDYSRLWRLNQWL